MNKNKTDLKSIIGLWPRWSDRNQFKLTTETAIKYMKEQVFKTLGIRQSLNGK
jgi:hypothetical protein